MKINISKKNIRAGEERAFRLFQRSLARGGGSWVAGPRAMGYRGSGRMMVQSVYRVARHVEGARLSRSLGARGVDSVSLSAVRTALRRLGDALIRKAEAGTEAKVSKAGARLARFIARTR